MKKKTYFCSRISKFINIFIMATATLKYLGNLRLELTHVQSGSQVITDAPVDNHGKGEAFSPTDLVATGLGACILTTIGIAGQTHGFSIDGAKAEVVKHMGTQPRRIVQIDVQIVLPHNQYTEKERKIIELCAKECAVSGSLHPDLTQNVSFQYGE